MNNLNKSVKKSKSIPPKKQDIIRNELKKFREIKENINLMNHSNILNKKQSIAPNKNYHNKFQQNYQNLTNLLSPGIQKIIKISYISEGFILIFRHDKGFIQDQK